MAATDPIGKHSRACLPVAAACKGADEQKSVISSARAFLRSVPEPTCYTRYSCHMEASRHKKTSQDAEVASPLLNLRASWLAGHALFGDTVLTLCRASPGEGGVTVWKPRSYLPSDVMRCLGQQFPSSAYTRACSAPIVSCLPTIFRSFADWHGALPTALLDSYCQRHGWSGAAATHTHCVPDVDEPDEVVATLKVVPFCGFLGDCSSRPESWVFNAGPCEPDTARQRTSLAALHALEVADLKTLQPSNLHTCLSSRCVGFASDSVITVQNAGDPHGREVADGVCVKVSITVTLVPPICLAQRAEPCDTAQPDQEAQPAPDERGAVSAATDKVNIMSSSMDSDPMLISMAGTATTNAAAPATSCDGVVVVDMLDTAKAHSSSVPGSTTAGAAPTSAVAGVVGAWVEVVEQVPALQLCIGTGMLLPGLETVIKGMRTGGAASIRTAVSLHGSGPCQAVSPSPHTSLPAIIDLKLQHVYAAHIEGAPRKVTGTTQKPLFSTPLSRQRYDMVARVLQEAGARSVLDCGCGAGAFLDYVLNTVVVGSASSISAPAAAKSDAAPAADQQEKTVWDLQRLVGIDISGSALQQACRRMEKVWLTPHSHAAGDTVTAPASGQSVDPSQPVTASGSSDVPAKSRLAFSSAGVATQTATSGSEAGADTALIPSSDPILTLELLQGSALSPALGPCVQHSSSSLAGAADMAGNGGVVSGGVDGHDLNLQPCKQQAPEEVFPGLQPMEEGKVAARWGDLHGIDAMVMIEVVEHLDPEPLSLMGPCILGGLRPAIAVITTPNWEYNALMRAAEDTTPPASTSIGSSIVTPPTSPRAVSASRKLRISGGNWQGPPGRDGFPMRCNDHRFEWNRQEFETWAGALAQKYGYAVRFEGIGQLINEKAALLSSAYQGAAEPGSASQAAIFTMMGHPLRTPMDSKMSKVCDAADASATAGGIVLPVPQGMVRVLGPCPVSLHLAAEVKVLGD